LIALAENSGTLRMVHC